MPWVLPYCAVALAQLTYFHSSWRREKVEQKHQNIPPGQTGHFFLSQAPEYNAGPVASIRKKEHDVEQTSVFSFSPFLTIF